MPTIITDDVTLDIPEWVTSLEAFRKWTDRPEFPEKLNAWWLRGRVWVDLCREQLVSNVGIRGDILAVLCTLNEQIDLGYYFDRGAYFTNVEADFSLRPDGIFLSYASFTEGRVKSNSGEDGEYSEIEGSADMLLEVASDSSEQRDFSILGDEYFAAGVKEYWLVDARESPPRFDILRRDSERFVCKRKQAGWLRSAVFSKSFRLIERKGRSGYSTHTLEMK